MKNVKNKIDMELDAQDAEFERLFECPEGCGRTFKRAALEKHVKVCKKLFQVKNDEAGYDDDAKASKPGKVQARGGSVQPQKAAAAEPQVLKKPVEKQKWKQESDNLKKLMKKGGAAAQTEDIVMVKEKDGVVVEKIPEAKLCVKCEENFQTEVLLKEHSTRCKGKPRVLLAAGGGGGVSKPKKQLPEQNFEDEF